MPLKKDSPFSPKDPAVGRKRAFKVVLFLAVVSFLCTLGGIYTDFLRFPTIQTVYYISKLEPVKSSLLDPQPPAEKQPSPETEAIMPENAGLLEKLEKEHTDIEQTAEALKESLESAAAAAEMKTLPIMPESEALQKLEQEKELADQKKLEEIEKLHQERIAAENKKIEPEGQEDKVPSTSASPAEASGEKTEELAGRKDKTEERPEVLSGVPSASERDDLPHPNLIEGNLMGSLPDFSLIKKNAVANAVPLHIIDPLPELQIDSRYGKLPVENNGKTPFFAYARSLEKPPASPYVAILFSGVGRRENATQSALTTLPEVVSLSFSPYAGKLKNYITDARKAGHETLLDLPMQQGAFPETDPGPLGLVSGLPEQENRKRLHKILGNNVAYIGIVAAANENFSYSGSQMKPFFDEILQRGLIYIDGTDNPRMPLFKEALRPDVHISGDFHRAAIRARLDRVRRIAAEKGSAFVRIETVPITLLTVLEWMKEFVPTEQNPVPEITFVPLSYYASAKKEKQ